MDKLDKLVRSKGKWELIILGLGRFGADLLGAEAGVGGLNFPRGSLAQRVDQLVEEVRDTSGRFTGQLLADGANDDVDILGVLEFDLNTTGIQDQGAGHAVACY